MKNKGAIHFWWFDLTMQSGVTEGQHAAAGPWQRSTIFSLPTPLHASTLSLSTPLPCSCSHSHIQPYLGNHRAGNSAQIYTRMSRMFKRARGRGKVQWAVKIASYSLVGEMVCSPIISISRQNPRIDELRLVGLWFLGWAMGIISSYI